MIKPPSVICSTADIFRQSGRRPDAGSMLGQRLRRQSSIEPALGNFCCFPGSQPPSGDIHRQTDLRIVIVDSQGHVLYTNRILTVSLRSHPNLLLHINK